MNVIITNVGRRGYLVDYFKSVPHFQGKVYTSDCDITASGLYGNNDGHFILPRPVDDEEKYVNELINICRLKKIDVIIPVIDPEIYILSGYKDLFHKNNISIVVSDRRVLDICFDKTLMNQFLDEKGIHFPKTFTSISGFEHAEQKGEIAFPVVLKPIFGSGSVDTYFLEDRSKLNALFHEGMIIQEKLNGIEYGTDTFNSFDGKPIRCVIKRKLQMRSGETDKCISVHCAAIEATLIRLATELKHIANLDCDVIVSEGIPYVIDMNPRFGGGYPATHAIGVNLVDILFRLLKGEKIVECFGEYPDDVLVMKEIGVRTTIVHNLV